jgi:hypothetical protein
LAHCSRRGRERRGAGSGVVADGSYTVLVPSVPTPMAGALYILPREGVHPVDVPFTKALRVFSKWAPAPGIRTGNVQPTPSVTSGNARG